MLAEQHPEQWLIQVKVNGVGFEPSQAERIFQRLKRLHDDEYPGMGGLAIYKRIVKRWGGATWAIAMEGRTIVSGNPEPCKTGTNCDPRENGASVQRSLADLF